MSAGLELVQHARAARRSIALSGARLDPSDVYEWSSQGSQPGVRISIEVSPGAREAVERCADFVARLAVSGRLAYGINTGFGHFAETPVPPERLGELQRNLIRSHAVGVGEELPRDVVLAMWILRLNTLCQGRSGIRASTIDGAIRLLEAGVLGCVPSRGSVGASGDLAPSAHAVLTLLGEGQCTRPDATGTRIERVPARKALEDLGVKPLAPAAKEGLALINGTQLTTALATKAWGEGCRLWHAANLAAAMTLEAVGGAFSILEEPVLASHHPGTTVAGRELARWLQSSEYLDGAGREGRFIQAPYSLRCAPQVHGAVWGELESGRDTLREESRVTSDNPIVFAEEERIVCAGNFHAIYPARVSDRIASAMATLGSISERRTNLLMDDGLTGLPRFLVADGGLNSGMMMLQVTAAALVSEAKALSMPASVDSIPTNCDREDHVSMGPLAGLKALQAIDRVRFVTAIELIAAAQALEMRKLRRVAPAVREALTRIREVVPFLDEDRTMAPEIALVAELIRTGALLAPQAVRLSLVPRQERRARVVN